MENGQKTLIELFNSDRNFIIPKYQRTFAWGNKQLSDFFSDIHNISNNETQDYFLGTVLFEKKDNHKGYELIEVVDGQQRITTLVIFMKCLLQLSNGSLDEMSRTKLSEKFLKDKYYHRLKITDMDNDFFRDFIIGDEKPNDNSFNSMSQKRLWKAKTFFIDELNKKIDQYSNNVLNKYIEKIKNCKILTYSVNNPEEATLIFETTNDRGKSLTNLEKIKSFLMYKTYLAVEKPEEYLISIHDKFSNMYKNLDKINNRLKEDTVLQYHFVGFEQWGKKDYQKYVTKLKGKINNLSIKNENDGLKKYITKYTFELKESFSRFYDILEDKNTYLRDVFILGRVGNFYPLINKVLRYDDTADKRNFYKIMHLVEQYSFRVYAINNRRSNTGQTTMFSLARDFKGNFNTLINDIRNNILYYSSDKDFERKLLSSFFNNEINKSDQNYLFWKYENFLRTNFQPKGSKMSEEEFLNDDTKTKLTIEHITAQKGINGLQFSDINDEEFKEKYLNSIGNLTIDPHSSNASKGKKIWETKNNQYFTKSHFKTQLELSDYVDIENIEWNEKSIEKRKIEIVNFALNYWNPNNIKSE